MSDRFGLLQIPVGAVAADPLLDVLLDFLKSAINNDAKDAWAVVHPAIIAPAIEPLPVGFTYGHDPDEGTFSSRTLPALFAWRSGFAKNVPLTQEWHSSVSTLSILWVMPPATLEKQRIRQPFRNLIAKCLHRNLERQRNPGWVVVDDDDPKAADFGTFLLPQLNVAKIVLVDVKPFDLVVPRGDKQEPFDAVLATVEVTELLVPAADEYDTLANIQGTVTGAGSPGLTMNAFVFAPHITSVTPSTGLLAGGTAITVVGSQFFEEDDLDALVVLVGGVPCDDVVLVDGDHITATTPAGVSIGAKDVVVVVPSGARSPALVGGFTYT